MAAQLINNPLIFNPADTSASIVFTNRMKIIQVEFAGYVDAANSCEIQNQLGQTVWYGDGKTDLDTVRSGRIGWINGLIVPANTTAGNVNIQSGRVFIYFE